MSNAGKVSKSASPRPQPVGGSRLGKPNKATALIKEMIIGALSDVGGQAYLAEQAAKNPVAFMALLGRVLPTQVSGPDGGPVTIQAVDRPPLETREEWVARRKAELGVLQ